MATCYILNQENKSVAPATNPKDNDNSLNAESFRRSQGKILIVDDQMFNLVALNIILEHKCKINCKDVCDKAISGQIALNMIQSNIDQNKKDHGAEKCDYHLILMDSNMPFMDGFETTSKIRDLINSYDLP